MTLSKITILPNTDVSKVDVTIQGIDDNGQPFETKSKTSLVLTAPTETEMYATTQGDPIPIVSFISEQLLDINTFFYVVVMAALKTAIQNSNEKQLADIYNDLNTLLDTIAIRNDEMRKEV